MDFLSPLVSGVHTLVRSRSRRSRASKSRWLAGRTSRSSRVGRSFQPLEPRLLMHANPVMDAEHAAVFGTIDATTHLVTGGLIPDASVTYRSVANGNWSDPAVWQHNGVADGTLPGNNDNVVIAAGTDVKIDGVIGSRLHTIRDDGMLEFDPKKNTSLLVDTLLVTSTGTFQMGTAANPIDPSVTAKVIFADSGPIDLAWDPLQFSRGLVTHGEVSIYGSQVTSFVPAASGLAAQATTITLASQPVGWKAGDRLIVTGNTATNSKNVNNDDQVEILAIANNVVTLKTPLKFEHTLGSTFVADVTRNARFESENVSVVARRGHVMFMHNDEVHVDSAGFYGLGRTDKRVAIDDPILIPDTDNPGKMTTDVLSTAINATDPKLGHRVLVPVLDANGQPVIVTNPDGTTTTQMQIARTGLNPRGRYAVHFHRTGTDPGDNPATITGSAVVDSPGWGIVNHSSNVDISENVVFNATGAAYITEAGDEIGSFHHNIAIHSQGSGNGIESRKVVQDFGHQGDGFWLQGGNVSLTDNVVSGQRHSGYVFFPVGLNQKGLGTTTISGINLTQYAWADPTKTYAVGDVPLKEFKGNVAFASGDGFESWFSLLNVTHSSRSVVEDFKVWGTNSGTGIFDPYTNQMTFKNVTVTGNVKSPGGTAFGRNDVTRNMIYDHVYAEGWNVGIDVPVNGANLIQGGRFNNLKSIAISTANSRNRRVDINDTPADPMVFVDSLTTRTGTPLTQFDVFLHSNFNPKENDITRLFNPDVIQMGTVMHNGKQLYYLEQAANYVPFDTTIVDRVGSFVPTELRDKTNQKLWTDYGLAVGGIVAPADATQSDPKINALIGSTAQYQPDLLLASKKYVNYTLESYTLAYKVKDVNNQIIGRHDSNGYVMVRESTPLPSTGPNALHEGWNLVTRTILGATRTLLVYGDSTAPTFEATSSLPKEINQADIDRGATIVIQGSIVDDSFGKKSFYQEFKLNDAEHVSAVHAKLVNGVSVNVVTISFTVSDLAGNKTQVNIDFAVTTTSILIKDIGRKNLPTIAPSITLIALVGHS